jgi:hypothetical protein
MTKTTTQTTTAAFDACRDLNLTASHPNSKPYAHMQSKNE